MYERKEERRGKDWKRKRAKNEEIRKDRERNKKKVKGLKCVN